MPLDLVEGDRLKDILQGEMDSQGWTEAKVEELRKQHEKDFEAQVEQAIAAGADLNARDEQGITMVRCKRDGTRGLESG